ncbi:MAG: hypothetical protein V4660_17155 [Pseudomonadota bacterium]
MATRFLNRYSIYILLIAIFVAHSFFLDVLPVWDAYQYFNSLSVASFSLTTLPDLSYLPVRIMDNFNFFGHPTMGYALIMSIPQLFDGSNEMLVNLTNILLALLSIFCFFKILQFFFKDMPELILFTALYAFDPLFFGSTVFLNADFPLLIFMTTALCSLLYNRKIFFFLSCLLLLFSKEPGILLYFAMTVGISLYSAVYLLQQLAHKKKIEIHKILPFNTTDKIGVANFILKMLCIFLPGILMLIYLLSGSATWVLNTTTPTDWNTFGYSWNIIKTRLFQIFGLNFHWIVSSVILVLFFVKGKLQNWSPEKKWFTIIVALVFLFFVGFNVSYITHLLPRYVIEAGFFLLFALALLLMKPSVNRYVRLGILSIILILFMIQTFRTVDPVSKAFYGTYKMNHHELLKIEDYPEAPEGWIYNTEWTVKGKLYNKMNREIEINENTVIITRESIANFFFSDNNFYGMSKASYIDRKSLRKTMRSENAFQYNLLPLEKLSTSNTPLEAFYIYRPWNYVTPDETRELSIITKYYEIVWFKEINYQGYTLNAYKLKKIMH